MCGAKRGCSWREFRWVADGRLTIRTRDRKQGESQPSQVVPLFNSLLRRQFDVGPAIAAEADDSSGAIALEQFANLNAKLKAAVPRWRIFDFLDLDDRSALGVVVLPVSAQCVLGG